MDDLIGNYLNTDKPSGQQFTKILFYLGVVYIIWKGLQAMWGWITWFDNDWDEALWGLIKTPFLTVLALMGLKVLTDIVMSIFKIRDDVAAGRSASDAPAKPIE